MIRPEDIERTVTRTEVMDWPREERHRMARRLVRVTVDGPQGKVPAYHVLREGATVLFEAAQGAGKMLQQFLRNVGAPLEVDDVDGLYARFDERGDLTVTLTAVVR